MSVDFPSLWDPSSSRLSCLCIAPRTSFFFFFKQVWLLQLLLFFWGSWSGSSESSVADGVPLNGAAAMCLFPWPSAPYVCVTILSYRYTSRVPGFPPGINCGLGKGVCRQFSFRFVMILIPTYILYTSRSLVCWLSGVFVLFVLLITFYWSIVASQFVLVSSAQQSESAMHIHIMRLF